MNSNSTTVRDGHKIPVCLISLCGITLGQIMMCLSECDTQNNLRIVIEDRKLYIITLIKYAPPVQVKEL